MALNIKSPYVDSLLAEVARSDVGIRMLLQNEIWPQMPADQMGVRLSKAEEAAILGNGEEGV